MRHRIGFVLIVYLLFASTARGAGELDALEAQAATETREQFKDEAIKPDDLAISVIDLREAEQLRTGSYRGDQPMFPASVVKLFYLAYAERLLEDGKLTDSEELQRGLRDMIVESSNDATSFILDTITDASNGSVLPPAEMEQWSAKRNAVNRYFASLGGYDKINVNQKAYCEGPYGRERIFIGPKFENRNKLTTDATAKLLGEIAQRRFVSAARSDAMMKLLSRDRTQKSDGPDDQAHGFIADALPPEVKVWSKAGWTSTARHDAAYIEGPEGLRAVLVIFTTGHGQARKIIPNLAQRLYQALVTKASSSSPQTSK